jgi:predicted dehydrogenase
VIERRPIRVGLVGCGNIAVGRHIPAYLAMPDFATVVAIADPTAARRDVALDALGLAASTAFEDGVELVDHADIDVVDVCTPPAYRNEVVRAALERGLPVLCEKPLAIVPAAADQLALASVETGTPLGLIHNYRLLPELVRARALVDAGDIGEPEVAILQFLGVEDRPGAAAYRPDWRHLAAIAGGGVLMDMIHVVYVAEFLLGHPIVRVSAHVSARTPGSPVEELALARYETDHGVALVNVGWGVGPGGFAISGSRGRIEIRNEAGATTPFRPPEELVLSRADGSVVREGFPPDPDEPVPAVYLRAAIREFLEAVAGGAPPPVRAADGAHVLEVALATYESAALGRTVTLPLDHADPVYQRGLQGIRELDLPTWSPVARAALFGVGMQPSEVR